MIMSRIFAATHSIVSGLLDDCGEYRFFLALSAINMTVTISQR